MAVRNRPGQILQRGFAAHDSHLEA